MAHEQPPTISLAEVRDRYDPNNSGRFLAKIFAEGDAEKWIHYVSPYGTGNEGGFVAVPEVGVTILVCLPQGSSEWYYLGSTFLGEYSQSEGDVVKDMVMMPLERVDPDLNTARGEPLHMVWKGERGGGLLISEDYNPTFFNVKTKLTSPEGKMVELNDSPGVDAITLDSKNGSKITISNDPQNNSVPAQAIQVESVGPQKFINLNSTTDIYVRDGQEINILNSSTGSNANGFEPDKCGNINIQSKKKDVNVFSVAPEGRIFLECLDEAGVDQVIVIKTNGGDGTIQISTQGKIELVSGGDFDLTCGENLNITAQNINMNSTGQILTKSSGTTEIQGSQIQLNPPGGVSPTAPTVADIESYYGQDGVTTYP